MNYEIHVKLLQDVLNFLGTCPYSQVSNLIPKLLELKKIEEPKEE